MRYAVAYMNFFDSDLKITIVKAPNPIVAIVEGVRKLTNCDIVGNVNHSVDGWLNSLLENMPTDGDYKERLEEISDGFFNTDQLVAVIQIN